MQCELAVPRAILHNVTLSDAVYYGNIPHLIRMMMIEFLVVTVIVLIKYISKWAPDRNIKLSQLFVFA